MRIQVSFSLISMDDQTIHIAVCDDDEAMLGFLDSEIHMAFQKKYCISIKMYSQPQLLMTDSDCQSFDLIFIDKDITYLECSGRKITANTINHEKIESIGKLKKHEKELEQHHFIRTHNSYLVSHRHIFSLEDDFVILMNQTKLPVSKHRRKKVKELLIAYIEH